MRQALLDALDRVLLALMFAFGYGLAAGSLLAAGSIALAKLGFVGDWPIHRSWTGELAWVAWGAAFCFLALAPIAWLFNRKVVRVIAKLDQAERPALRVVTIIAGMLAIGLVGYKALGLLVYGEHDGSGYGRFAGAAVLCVVDLAYVGVYALEQHWPFARSAARRDELESDANAPKSRILLP